MDAINKVDLDTLKDYLTRLEKLEDYHGHLQEHGNEQFANFLGPDSLE